jgi:uncharacterized protein (TIGR01244 family)
MGYSHLTADFAVSPQITTAEMADLAKAGFTTVLCNRPDEEVSPALGQYAMQAAAQAAGMAFVYNPIDHRGITPQQLALQAETATGGGKVLAYCNSGNRSTILWAFAHAKTHPVAEMIEMAEQAGYSLRPFERQLQSLAKA